MPTLKAAGNRPSQVRSRDRTEFSARISAIAPSKAERTEFAADADGTCGHEVVEDHVIWSVERDASPI